MFKLILFYSIGNTDGRKRINSNRNMLYVTRSSHTCLYPHTRPALPLPLFQISFTPTVPLLIPCPGSQTVSIVPTPTSNFFTECSHKLCPHSCPALLLQQAQKCIDF